MKHPNIVSFIGAGWREEGCVESMFLVIEHLGGGDLDKKLQETKRMLAFSKKEQNFGDCFEICIQIGAALEYLHETNESDFCIIHRDIKPSNIGFTLSGKPKLLDFGLSTVIAKAGHCSETYLMTGKTGTPRYMAPEVGLKHSYNCKVDVYSFSILCWQMFSLKKPFEEVQPVDFYQKVFIEGIRPECPKDWPEGLTLLLENCWRASFEQRPNIGEILKKMKILYRACSNKPFLSFSLRPCHAGAKKRTQNKLHPKQNNQT